MFCIVIAEMKKAFIDIYQMASDINVFLQRNHHAWVQEIHFQKVISTQRNVVEIIHHAKIYFVYRVSGHSRDAL
jgi:GTP-sensing pleiotropic transcriptional regulator CodY